VTLRDIIECASRESSNHYSNDAGERALWEAIGVIAQKLQEREPAVLEGSDGRPVTLDWSGRGRKP